MRMFRVFAFLLIAAALGFGQTDHGVMQREANLYVSPDLKSQKLGRVLRGREVVVLDTSHEFLKVLAELDNECNVSGWLVNKGVVTSSTPNGDQVLFAEAIDSENEASRRGGPK